MKSEHKDILNKLVEMQESPYYSTRKTVLAEAERLIFSLEERLLKSEKRTAEMRSSLQIIHTWASSPGALDCESVINLTNKTLGIA
jgi:hypothetical protein